MKIDNQAIETGCLKGAIEGYVINGVWGQEMVRVEKLCSNPLFSEEEQVWCMEWTESRLSFIR